MNKFFLFNVKDSMEKGLFCSCLEVAWGVEIADHLGKAKVSGAKLELHFATVLLLFLLAWWMPIILVKWLKIVQIEV